MRDKIQMKSTGKTAKGKPTGTFRVTNKNKKISTEKLKKKYFDKLAYNATTGKCGMHVVFEEAKLPSSSK